MQKAVGGEEEMDRCDNRDGDAATRFASGRFLLTARCLVPSVLSVPLCLCG
jgi:hypothetical protein